MTIRQLFLAAAKFLIYHPQLMPMPTYPLTRHGMATTYDSQFSRTSGTFDADVRANIRASDTSYQSTSDNDLQALIDEAVGLDEDITSDLDLPGDN